ncbi:MAG TPA: DUF6077 domain-containing protein [Gaiellaceae bacterium]|jgi:hypothetical protein
MKQEKPPAVSAPRTSAAAERFGRSFARVSDAALDFLVVAFAGWTIVYHACLVLHLGTTVAAVAGGLLLIPSAWFVLRTEPPALDERAPLLRFPRLSLAGNTRARIAHVLLAAVAALLFVVHTGPWVLTWGLWALAALGTVLLTARVAPPSAASAPRHDPPLVWPSAFLAIFWALALGGLSLFLVRGNGDDAYYVHLAAWVAAHGSFPLRDTLFTDQALPAIIFPPISSLEGLEGAAARITGVNAPSLVYLGLTPLTSALSVLAFWRLLRAWGIRLVGFALSMMLAFLLVDVHGHKTLGSAFVSRLWQGKVIFLCVLVPVIFVLVAQFSARPGRRSLFLLAAAGVAAIGLTPSAAFVVPLIAAGMFIALFRPSWRVALAGASALLAYPIVTTAVTLAVGSRNAQQYRVEDVVPHVLLRLVLGTGAVSFLAIIAILLGPLVVSRAVSAFTTASTGLVLICLYAPGVGVLVFHLTGFGQVLWRWTWAVPVSALVGALGAALLEAVRPPAARAVAVAAGCVLLFLFATPVWSTKAAGGRPLAHRPVWKQGPNELTSAREILAIARPGDSILAPGALSTTILAASGDVTTVANRVFYTHALEGVPGAHGRDRLVLLAFANGGIGPVTTPVGKWVDTVDAAEVRRALDALHPDLACVPQKAAGAEDLLTESGYRRVATTHGVVCFRPPGEPS